MANEREIAANDDICAVIARLVASDRAAPASRIAGAGDGATPCADLATLEAFGLDHAHHEDRLPQLLRELSTARAA